MAYSIDYTVSFKKDYKRLKKRGLPLDKLEETIKILVKTGTLPAEYRPHKLSGDYAGKWECHIAGRNSDWLMVWDQNDTELTLLMLRTALTQVVCSTDFMCQLEKLINISLFLRRIADTDPNRIW